ncbi:MAG TPA: hypothetical protein VMW32_12360 [Bacteroidales bacterium]|nr:hypothetical protein [Bacteroidales bacterium]
MSIRDEMVLNAKAHNKFLTNRYLSKLSDEELLCFVHPIERELFRQKLRLE